MYMTKQQGERKKTQTLYRVFQESGDMVCQRESHREYYGAVVVASGDTQVWKIWCFCGNAVLLQNAVNNARKLYGCNVRAAIVEEGRNG